MGGNDTAFAEGVVEKLEVRLLEQALGRAFGVGRVGNDDVKGVLVVVEELEAIANVDGGLGVSEADCHVGEVLLGDAGDGLVNVAEDGFLDRVVLDDLAEDTTVTAANDEDLLGVGVRVHGEVGDHLLVGELVALGALNDIIKNEDVAVVGRLEDQDVLELALFVVEDLFDLEGHGLAYGEFVVRSAWCIPRPNCRSLPGHMLEISRNQPSIASQSC